MIVNSLSHSKLGVDPFFIMSLNELKKPRINRKIKVILSIRTDITTNLESGDVIIKGTIDISEKESNYGITR